MESISEKTFQKILNAFSQKDGFLFGDITFDLPEKEEIKRVCQSIINHNLPKRHWPINFPEILTAFLIITTKNYSKDWNGYVYWDKIIPELGFNRKLDYTAELPSVAECFKKYNLPFFRGSNKENRYVESLFFQAYSPKNSINAFIKLAYKLFTDVDVFDYIYETDIEYCLAIIKMLSRQYSGDELDNDIDFEGEKYSIRSGLRYAFKNSPRLSAQLLNRILNYINDIYNKNEDISQNEDYLATLCIDTMDSIFSKKTSKKERKKASSCGVKPWIDDLQNFKTSYFFDYEDNKLYLFLPKIRLYKIEKEYEKMNIDLYVNINGIDLNVNSLELYTHGLDFKKCFTETLICLNDHFPICCDSFNFKLKVHLDDDLILDTKEDLFRHFLIFKNEREIRGNCKPNNYSIVVPTSFNIKNSTLKNGMSLLTDNIYFINTEEDDRLSHLNYNVFFNSRKSNTHYYFDSESTVIEQIMIKYKDKDFSVYTNLNKMTCIVDDLSNAKSLVYILKNFDSGSEIKSALINCTTSVNTKFEITDFLHLDNGFYTFCVIDTLKNNNNLIFETNFLLDKKAKLSISNDISFLGNKIEVKGNLLEKHFQKKVSVTKEVEELNLEELTIQLYLPYFNWNINNSQKNWNFMPEQNPILFGYHGHIESNDILNIDTSYEIISVLCGNKELLKGTKNGTFKLGNFVFSESKSSDDLKNGRVVAKVLINKNIIDIPLFRLSKSPYISNEDYIIQQNDEYDNILSLENNFIGNEDTIFVFKVTQIVPDNGFEITIEDNFIKNPCNLSKKLDDGVYTAALYYMNNTDSKGLNFLTDNIYFTIGDEAQFRFDPSETLTLYKCVPSNKFKGHAELKNINFLEDDGFSYIFSCVLNTEKIKKFSCYFKTDSNSTKALKLFYKENGEKRYFSYDTIEKCISKNKIDNMRYILCETVYCK